MDWNAVGCSVLQSSVVKCSVVLLNQVGKGSSNFAKNYPLCLNLSPFSQAWVTVEIAVIDSTSVFISSLQWSQRISIIQLGIYPLPNLNVVLGIIKLSTIRKVPHTGDTNSLDRCGWWDRYKFEEQA